MKVKKQNNSISFLKWRITAIFILLSFSVFSQSLLKEIPYYEFIDSTANHISYPENERNLETFYNKLDTLLKTGKGNVRIVHFGGSHIQADIWSHKLRMNLLNIKPDLASDRGLIFPFSAAGTNNPRNYQTSSSGNWKVTKNTYQQPEKPLGASGIAITTDSIASIGIKLRNEEEPTFYFNKVRLIGFDEFGTYNPTLYTDSITSFSPHFELERSTYTFDLENKYDGFSLQFIPRDTLSNAFTIQGIYLENDQDGLTYNAIGVNGASVPSYLKCEGLERDLKLLNPDLVILSIGINDAVSEDFDPVVFKENYTQLINRIRAVAPHTCFLFTTNNDSFRREKRKYYVNPNGILVEQAFYELAQEQHAAVWDLFAIMGGLNSMAQWEEAGLAAKDKIHFNRDGYNLLGDLLFNALMEDYYKNHY